MREPNAAAASGARSGSGSTIAGALGDCATGVVAFGAMAEPSALKSRSDSSSARAMSAAAVWFGCRFTTSRASARACSRRPLYMHHRASLNRPGTSSAFNLPSRKRYESSFVLPMYCTWSFANGWSIDPRRTITLSSVCVTVPSTSLPSWSSTTEATPGGAGATYGVGTGSAGIAGVGGGTPGNFAGGASGAAGEAGGGTRGSLLGEPGASTTGAFDEAATRGGSCSEIGTIDEPGSGTIGGKVEASVGNGAGTDGV